VLRHTTLHPRFASVALAIVALALLLSRALALVLEGGQLEHVPSPP
jgi:hypothetical protein